MSFPEMKWQNQATFGKNWALFIETSGHSGYDPVIVIYNRRVFIRSTPDVVVVGVGKTSARCVGRPI